MTDNGDDNRALVSILDGTNYRQWSIEMKHLLLAKGVYYYANGDDTLGENATPKEKKKFRDGDGRALGLIVGHIHRPLHEAVAGITTSAALWEHLKNIHQPRTRDHLQAKFARFWDLRMQPGQPMASWTAAFANAAAELRAENFPIDDRSMCFQVTRFLPPEYEAILRTLSELPDPEYNYQNITTKLIAEESRLGQKAMDGNGGTNFSNYNGNVPPRGRKAQRGRGGRARGHKRGANNNTSHQTTSEPYAEADFDEEELEVETNWNAESSNPNRQPPIVCRRCGVKGHFSSQCMAPRPMPRNRNPPQQRSGNPNKNRSHSTLDEDVEELLNYVQALHIDDFEDRLFSPEPEVKFPNAMAIGTTMALDKVDEINISENTMCLLTNGFNELIESAQISLDSETVFTIDTTNIWLMDSGASSHFCNNREMFHEFRPCRTMAKTTGKSGKLTILGHGTIDLQIGDEIIKFGNTCYAPDARVNLISEGRIDLAGLSQVKNNGIHRVITANRKLLFEARLTHNLYMVSVKNNASLGKTAELEATGPLHLEESNVTLPPPCETIAQEPEVTNQTEEPKAKVGDYELWHRRMGHIHEIVIRHLARQKIVRGLPDVLSPKSETSCTGCRLGKATRAQFGPIGGIKSSKVLELLHMDVWGPTKYETSQGHQYFLSVIDDFTRKVEVFLMRRKGEVFPIIKQYITRIEREQNSQVINIRTDNGMEFCHKEFNDYCSRLGIMHQRTNIYTPEQNGVAERFNRTIVEQSRTMINSAGLPKQFWGEAIKTATFIRNRITSSNHNDTTAHELWTGRKPSMSFWKIFGCLAFVQVPKAKRDKHDNAAKKGIMLGYSTETVGYRIMLLETKQIVESKSVTFDETRFPGKRMPNLRIQKGPTPAPRKLPYKFNSDSDDNDEFMDSDSSDDNDPPESPLSSDQGFETMLKTPTPTDSGTSRNTPVEDVTQGHDDSTPFFGERGHLPRNKLEAQIMQKEQELLKEHHEATVNALRELTSTQPPMDMNKTLDPTQAFTPISSENSSGQSMRDSLSTIAETELEELVDDIEKPESPPHKVFPKTPVRKPMVPDPKYLKETTIKRPDGTEVNIVYDLNDYDSDVEPAESIMETEERKLPAPGTQLDPNAVHFFKKSMTTYDANRVAMTVQYYQAEGCDQKLFTFEEICNYCTRRGIRTPLRRQVNLNQTKTKASSHDQDA